MEARKLRFLSSCQYTHGCYVPASWAAQHTIVCLDLKLNFAVFWQDIYAFGYTGCAFTRIHRK